MKGKLAFITTMDSTAGDPISIITHTNFVLNITVRMKTAIILIIKFNKYIILLAIKPNFAKPTPINL